MGAVRGASLRGCNRLLLRRSQTVEGRDDRREERGSRAGSGAPRDGASRGYARAGDGRGYTHARAGGTYL